MKEVTATGQTIEEAVESALAQLKTTRDRMELQVIDEGKKGFLGLFGSRPAIVKAKLKYDPISEVKKFLMDVTRNMGVDAQIDVKREGKVLDIYFSGEKMALLIGKRGQTLNSLQYLTQLFVNRQGDQFMNVILNAEDYREKRKETLMDLAGKMASKAVRTKRPVKLEPMPSFERKVIHAALVSNRQVKTHSEGAEPNRYLVINPVSQPAGKKPKY
ncbi:RNA-binding cell elongation regulator Jag/EloR [Falsibacillus pallidus]|uniref:RNA-binding protein KhpB n=1 Tax=Falsibacillus pallidus TaxID=493781 RepID=A0A370GEM4_9BACI|nr:RNA-binding cell elongation regulator Jag/EloR [Falsibacillus pallidus]RDI40874.1 spoIIIJ-associated protein [Falsibacillus pallidus]